MITFDLLLDIKSKLISFYKQLNLISNKTKLQVFLEYLNPILIGLYLIKKFLTMTALSVPIEWISYDILFLALLVSSLVRICLISNKSKGFIQ